MKDAADVKGDMALRTTSKLMVNAGYGKFGASYKFRTADVTDISGLSKIMDMYKVHSVIDINNNIKVAYRDVMPKDDVKAAKHLRDIAFKKAQQALQGNTTNVAIARAITSHGRIVLYKLMQEIMDRGGKMLYTDTDRVFAQLPTNPFGKPFGPFT